MVAPEQIAQEIGISHGLFLGGIGQDQVDPFVQNSIKAFFGMLPWIDFDGVGIVRQPIGRLFTELPVP